MLIDDAAWQWQIRRQPLEIMIAAFRRKTRIAAALLLILILYLLVGLVPDKNEKLWGFTYVKSSYDWSKRAFRYPIDQYTPLPTGKPRSLPKVQYAFQTDTSPEGKAREEVLANRREEVRKAFVKSWTSYKNVGFGYDELLPVSGTGRDVPGFGGWGATLTDSLSTLWIMDLKDEFYEAAAAAVTINWAKTKDSSCNFFETTIRHLGGLLGAYDMSKETALLEKAIELGDMLYTAYDTPNHMPPFWLDFDDARNGQQVAGYHDPSAAVASQSLEFTRLSQLTGNDKYYDAINRVTEILDEWQDKTSLPGMWPTFFDLYQQQLNGDKSFTLGALADSLYEYLPKTFAILGGLEPMYEKLYRGAMDTVIKHLLFRPMTPDQTDILFSGNVYVSSETGPRLTPEGQHLGCFVGGMFGLGGKLFDIPEHVTIGEKITRGCVWVYDAMPAGIAPEYFSIFPCETLEPCEWNQVVWDEQKGADSFVEGLKNARDPRYLLRPEAIESVFIMYRITGNPEYQDMAWRMFQAIRNATETEYGFSSILSVRETETQKTDSMESFWLAETLRYFYLVFSSPDLVSLDEYVLNTEAHPLRRPKPQDDALR